MARADLCQALSLTILMSACFPAGSSTLAPAGSIFESGEDPLSNPVIAETLDVEARAWVDATLAGLTLRELIGQMIIEWIPGGYVTATSTEFEPLRAWVEDDQIGGVSPSIGTPHALSLIHISEPTRPY